MFHMHVIFLLTFFLLFVVKNLYVLEFNNFVCKFDKRKKSTTLFLKNYTENVVEKLFPDPFLNN